MDIAKVRSKAEADVEAAKVRFLEAEDKMQALMDAGEDVPEAVLEEVRMRGAKHGDAHRRLVKVNEAVELLRESVQGREV